MFQRVAFQERDGYVKNQYVKEVYALRSVLRLLEAIHATRMTEYTMREKSRLEKNATWHDKLCLWIVDTLSF